MADDQSSSSSVAEKSEREEKKTGAACLDKAYWSSWNSTYAAIAWGLTVLVYVLVGGAFFLLAERPNEVREIEQAQAARARAQDLLVELVMNLSNGSFGELNATEAEAVVNDLVELADALALLPAETSPIWEYGPSVFFATTVVTTIGYGNISPSTLAGQILFIFYALLGIPILLIFLTNVGALLAAGQDFALSPLGKKSVFNRLLGILIAAVVALIFVILIPAVIFYAVEGWTYGEAIYYCFVSLTTVGFGDFVPGQSTKSRANTTITLRGLYKICITFWLIIGLSFVALLIDDIQKLLKTSGKKLRECYQRHQQEKRGSYDVTNSELVQTMEGVSPSDKPVVEATTSLQLGQEEEGGGYNKAN